MNNKHLPLAVAQCCRPANIPRAVDYQCPTAQDLQNALAPRRPMADDNLYLTNCYYVGKFNFDFNFISAEARNLTLQAEPGVTSDHVTTDSAGGGRSLNLSHSAANLTENAESSQTP